MGRQIAIAMAPDDEAAFVDFLKSTADVRFVGSFAPEPEQLWADDPPPAATGHYFYSIWNKKFPWQPHYGQVGPQAHDPSQIGWYYVSDTSTAPLLEWGRCDIGRQMFGRLYWSKPTVASYGIAEFETWVNSIWRWVRKNGRKLQPGDLLSPYCFPHAERELRS
jgi:hypothetical protein